MAQESQPLLELKGVNLKFGSVWALKNVSLTLLPGETRIIFGSAGSGKTMLLKAVIGLVTVDSGEIKLFGQDVTQLEEHDLYALRSRAGFLFQEGGLFDSLSIGENVEYPLLNRQAPDGGKANGPPEGSDTEARVRETLRFVELEQTFDKFPSEVSGGMRRRVGIARAVVTEPPLVLYDSPTAGLDPITANTIMVLIVKERDVDNTTALVVTHRYQDGNLVANFRYNPDSGKLDPAGEAGTNTIYMVLREGRLVFEGGQAELEASKDSYICKFVKRPEAA